MWMALVVATATGLATGFGVLPFLVRPTIPRRVYDAVLGLGAGLMIAAATLGLMREALEHVRPGGTLSGPALLQVLAGFAMGVGLLALMDGLIPHQHAGGHREHISRPHRGHGADSSHPHELEHGEPVRHHLLITGAMTIHRLPEGFAIGAGFASGGAQGLGWVLGLAVAFQNICEGAVMGAPFLHAGLSRARTLAVVSATGVVVPLAALVGYATAAYVTGALPFVLALAAGALIYLISNEIIPETHSHGNEGAATLGLVTGFLVVVVLQSLGHH